MEGVKLGHGMMQFTFWGQRERLVVMWGARGEQEVLGASYCSVPDDGQIQGVRCLADSTC